MSQNFVKLKLLGKFGEKIGYVPVTLIWDCREKIAKS